MKINIAIDRPSVAGKSIIAKILTKELGYSHLDAGTVYHYTALASKKHGVNPSDEAALTVMLDEVKISFDPVGNVYLNNEDASKQIHENEISMLTGSIPTHPKMRERLVTLQQQMV